MAMGGPGSRSLLLLSVCFGTEEKASVHCPPRGQGGQAGAGRGWGVGGTQQAGHILELAFRKVNQFPSSNTMTLTHFPLLGSAFGCGWCGRQPPEGVPRPRGPPWLGRCAGWTVFGKETRQQEESCFSICDKIHLHWVSRCCFFKNGISKTKNVLSQTGVAVSTGSTESRVET